MCCERLDSEADARVNFFKRSAKWSTSVTQSSMTVKDIGRDADARRTIQVTGLTLVLSAIPARFAKPSDHVPVAKVLHSFRRKLIGAIDIEQYEVAFLERIDLCKKRGRHIF